MRQILIVGHSSYPDGLLAAAQMIVGTELCRSARAIGLTDGEQFRADVAEVLQETSGQELLILADLLGGSPCNLTLEVLRSHGVDDLVVVTGVNLGFLIEALVSRDSLDVLAKRSAPRVLELNVVADSDDPL